MEKITDEYTDSIASRIEILAWAARSMTAEELRYLGDYSVTLACEIVDGIEHEMNAEKALAAG